MATTYLGGEKSTLALDKRINFFILTMKKLKSNCKHSLDFRQSLRFINFKLILKTKMCNLILTKCNKLSQNQFRTFLQPITKLITKSKI